MKKKPAKDKPSRREPTKEQWDALRACFRYFNERLFQGALPEPIIQHSRHRGSHGFYRPRSFLDGEHGYRAEPRLRWIPPNRLAS
jgi:hypothetical protein